MAEGEEMKANPARVKLTYDDFLLFPDDRKRHELIDGEHYERSGVSEYWIVDPDLDVVGVYRNRDERFGRPVELRADAGDVLTSPHLDGLEMPVGRIFAE